MTSLEFPILVDFLARLDTLHDFCGSRNTLVSKDIIIRHAGISPEIVQGVKGMFEKVLRDQSLREDTYNLIDDLSVYKPYKYKSFEHGILELIRRARTHVFNNPINESIVNVSSYNQAEVQRFFEDNFNIDDVNVDKNRYIIDTSSIPQDDVFCKLGKIAVTNATYFDKKTNVGIDTECQDQVVIDENSKVRITNGKKECIYFNEIRIFDDAKNNHYMELVYPDNRISKVDFKKVEKIGVAVYSEMINNILQGHSLQGFYNVIFNAQNDTFIHKVKAESQIKAIFDFKRSGDWLQIETFPVVQRDAKPTIFATIDRPAVARALIKTQDVPPMDIPVVCTGEDGQIPQITAYGKIPMTEEHMRNMVARINNITDTIINLSKYSANVNILEQFKKNLTHVYETVRLEINNLIIGCGKIHDEIKKSMANAVTYNARFPAPTVGSVWIDIIQTMGLKLLKYCCFLEKMKDDQYRQQFIAAMKGVKANIPRTFEDGGASLIRVFNDMNEVLMNNYINDHRMIDLIKDIPLLIADMERAQTIISYLSTKDKGFLEFGKKTSAFNTMVQKIQNIHEGYILSNTAADAIRNANYFIDMFIPATARVPAKFNWQGEKAAPLDEQKDNVTKFDMKMTDLYITGKGSVAYCINIQNKDSLTLQLLQNFKDRIIAMEQKYDKSKQGPPETKKRKTETDLNQITVDEKGELSIKIKSLTQCINAYKVVERRVKDNFRKFSINGPQTKFVPKTYTRISKSRELVKKLREVAPSLVKANNKYLEGLLRGIDDMDDTMGRILQLSSTKTTNAVSVKRRKITVAKKTKGGRGGRRKIKGGQGFSESYDVAERIYQSLQSASSFHGFPFILALMLTVDELVTDEEMFEILDDTLVPRTFGLPPLPPIGQEHIANRHMYVKCLPSDIDIYDMPLMYALEARDDMYVYVNSHKYITAKFICAMQTERMDFQKHVPYRAMIKSIQSRKASSSSKRASMSSTFGSPKILSLGSKHSVKTTRSAPVYVQAPLTSPVRDVYLAKSEGMIPSVVKRIPSRRSVQHTIKSIEQPSPSPSISKHLNVMNQKTVAVKNS